MRRNISLIVIIYAVFLYGNCHATGMVQRYSGEFVRSNGKPVIESLAFQGGNGPAIIKLFNGKADGSLASRVSSATLKINGAVVFGPSSFNQIVGYLEKPLTLKQGDNTLEVLLNGKPGGKIKIEIAQEVDYSGTYCLLVEETDSVMATEVVINQSDSTATVLLTDLANLTVTGSIEGNTLTLTEVFPEIGEFNMVLTFSDSGETLSGTFSMGESEGMLTGSKNRCANYTYPEGDPICILPFENLFLVTGGQQYNSVNAGIRHSGLDFKFVTPLPNIIAPCDGVIKQIKRNVISEGNIIYNVDIRYNQNWGTFIAFEPYSADSTIADMQESEISVSVNQVVKRGDVLGRLVVPVPLTEFPHIHWGVYRNDMERSDVCPKEYLTPEAQSELESLYGSFGLIPVCLP